VSPSNQIISIKDHVPVTKHGYKDLSASVAKDACCDPHAVIALFKFYKSYGESILNKICDSKCNNILTVLGYTGYSKCNSILTVLGYTGYSHNYSTCANCADDSLNEDEVAEIRYQVYFSLSLSYRLLLEYACEAKQPFDL
jgi:hypothetical protein